MSCKHTDITTSFTTSRKPDRKNTLELQFRCSRCAVTFEVADNSASAKPAMVLKAYGQEKFRLVVVPQITGV